MSIHSGTSASLRETDRHAVASFALIETMYYRHRIRLLDSHLERMAASAAHFAIPFDRVAAHAAIEAVLRRDVNADGAYKVRITLDQTGVFTGVASPVERVPKKHRRLCISPFLVNPEDPFFYHKTTLRELYESEFKRASAAGYDEVLFFNTAGMLAEGSRHNVFVRIDDNIYTPPLTSGVLNGVYRQQVMARCSGIKEQPISKADVARASALYLTNAVRGLRRYPLGKALAVLNFLSPENT